jgi:hypothetical protein
VFDPLDGIRSQQIAFAQDLYRQFGTRNNIVGLVKRSGEIAHYDSF